MAQAAHSRVRNRGGIRLIPPFCCLSHSRSLLLALVGALLLGGCSPLFQKPTVNCSSVTFAGVGSEGVDLKVTLQVDNRNRFPILVQGYSYSLTVMDTPFSTGSEMRELSLAPRTTTEVVLPLQVPLASILEILAKRPDPDRVTYELEAVLDIRTSFAARRLPVTSSGQFSIPSKYRPDHYLRQLRRLLPNVQG